MPDQRTHKGEARQAESAFLVTSPRADIPPCQQRSQHQKANEEIRKLHSAPLLSIRCGNPRRSTPKEDGPTLVSSCFEAELPVGCRENPSCLGVKNNWRNQLWPDGRETDGFKARTHQHTAPVFMLYLIDVTYLRWRPRFELD